MWRGRLWGRGIFKALHLQHLVLLLVRKISLTRSMSLQPASAGGKGWHRSKRCHPSPRAARASAPPAPKDQAPVSQRWRLLLVVMLVLGCAGLGIWLFSKSASEAPFGYDDAGNPVLHPERLAKMEREIEKLDEAEQYALLAAAEGWYPCFNCLDAQIFLLAGEVWKYGVTTNGSSRYSESFYATNRLLYFSQFKGTLQECLQEEKRKIYHYAILPENVKRQRPLLRPPGNKNDS
jgi:hypothetical protein